MLKYFAGFNVLLYYSYAYLYFFNEELTAIKPAYWYMLSISAGFIYLFLSGKLKIKFDSSLYMIAWAAILFLFSALSYTISIQPEAGFQTLISWMESLLLLILFIYIFQDEAILHFAAKSLVLVLFISVLINYYDFVFPGMFSKDIGRAAGMYENANISGGYLVFGMVISVWVFPKRMRSLYCIFIATGVIVTFSRSSMMMWAMAMLLLAWKNAFVVSRGPAIMSMFVLMLFLVLTLVSGVWFKVFQAVGVDSYLSENAKNRIGGSFIEQKDNASLSRQYAAKLAWGLFIKSPIIGHGLGSTQEGNTAVGAHNMYLRLAVEMGIIGFIFIVALIVILWKSSSNVASIIAILYTFLSFFTHNSIEQVAMQIIIAMSVAGTLEKQNSEFSGNNSNSTKELSQPKPPLSGVTLKLT